MGRCASVGMIERWRGRWMKDSPTWIYTMFTIGGRVPAKLHCIAQFVAVWFHKILTSNLQCLHIYAAYVESRPKSRVRQAHAAPEDEISTEWWSDGQPSWLKINWKRFNLPESQIESTLAGGYKLQRFLAEASKPSKALNVLEPPLNTL